MKKINLTELLKSIIFCFYIVALAWVIFSLIWVPLDFTLTMLCWMGLFGIFDGFRFGRKKWFIFNSDFILAWCKLSDIEPYKE